MSESRFQYLIDKINKAKFIETPFKHIEINDFINEEDFNEIIFCDEINIRNCKDDAELLKELFSQGYKMVPFPGAITDHNKYVANRIQNKKKSSHSATESAGVVVRLINPKSKMLQKLKKFLESVEFNRAIASKFDLNFSECLSDGGIQKYLDEYEISPHPDLRKKAATFMVNINNSPHSESKNHHTHYLKFKSEKKYVAEYWRGNPLVERCWVPWTWCDTVKQQKKNNSLVAFAPSYNTLHAVKASYNHLIGQRTQLYGNLWYKDEEKSNFKRSVSRLDWEDFDFKKSTKKSELSIFKSALNITKKKIKKIISNPKKNSEFVDETRKDNY